MNIPYKTVYSKRRTIGISIDRSGAVVVRAPIGCPVSAIERFVSEEADWIEKQLAKHRRSALEAEREGTLTAADLKRLAGRMRPVLEEKLPHYAARLCVSFNRVTIRAQKSKWGSCTAGGNLNFNCLLMLAPEEVLDYVIVHELCHRKHMDHSPAFWAEVARILPDYQKPRKWLKENGGILLARARDGQ